MKYTPFISTSDRPNSVSAECSAEYSAEAEYSVTVAELTIRLTNFGRKKSFFSENFAFFLLFFLYFSLLKVVFFFKVTLNSS